jgi:glycosyltransferase involved in cell wall biosynthesis
MWRAKSVSVILPTYNEKDSIRECIEQFFATGYIDEVLVINNNAAAGTSEEVAKTAAREIVEPRRGYGSAIQRGLKEAKGDLLVVCEPDGTFHPEDVVKFLAYSEDCDAVYGTRTVRTMIWEGANMGLFLKWGNWAVAKLAEALFNTEHLSDVGCTFRLIRREAVLPLLPRFQITASAFGLEMMMWSILARHRLVQIPVSYRSRVGKSAVTGSFWKAFALGCRMILLILSFRLNAGRLRRRDGGLVRMPQN